MRPALHSGGKRDCPRYSEYREQQSRKHIWNLFFIIAGRGRKIKMELAEKQNVILADVMCDMMDELERAESVLWAAHEIYFHDEQKAISASSAKVLGDLLVVYLSMTNGIVKQCKGLVGEW